MLIREARTPLMRISATTLAFVVLLCSTVAAGQPAPGAAVGRITDSSGGVLPGTTIVATATADGRVLQTTVSDGSGSFALRGLPSGSVTITFQLEGFSSFVAEITIEPGVDARIAPRLELAPVAETVVVKGRVAAVPRIVAAPPPPPPPPPPPVLQPVPAHDRDSICGPAKASAPPESLGTIQVSRDMTHGDLFTTGAQIVVSGGVRDGLEAGRNLVVRRAYVMREWGSLPMTAEHSAGLLQIVTPGDRTSLAVVVYACDEFRAGDFLAPFAPEPVRDPEPPGRPSYGDAARILFADEGQTLGAPRRLMVIDRGTDHGIHAGQRLTLFRPRRGTTKPDILGDAIVVAVRADSATIRVVRVTDIVSSGDLAAPQTTSPTTR